MYFLFLLILCNFFSFGRDDFNISLSWSGDRATKGAKIAIDEINSRSKVKATLNVFNDEGYIAKGAMNAQKIAESNDIAVIGHRESDISLSVVQTYEFNDVIMLNPSSTAGKITSNGYRNIFRLIPNDEVLSTSLANYFIENNLKRVMLCYSSNDYGISFANSFNRSIESLGGDIVDRISFLLGDEKEFKILAKKWEHYNFDSIMFIGDIEESINFVRVMSHFNVKIACSETVVDDLFIDELKDLSEGVVSPMLFDKNSSRAKDFVAKFKDQNGRDPTYIEALSYDAVNLLWNAFKVTKSKDTEDLTAFLKGDNPFEGVANTYSFEISGNLKVSNVAIQRVKDSKFQEIGRY